MNRRGGHNRRSLPEGERIGRWTVQAAIQIKAQSSYQLCRCDCGIERFVLVRSLRHGGTQSCGCLSKELAAARKLTHGHARRIHGRSGTKAYRTWNHMMSRCTNPRVNNYADYGGRGIKVCERWQKFENFLEDMGEPPPRASIDRVDNDGNYEPGNCEWRTPREQSSNRRNNILVTHAGTSLILSEWARVTGISYAVLLWRFKRNWPTDRLFSQARKMTRSVNSNGT